MVTNGKAPDDEPSKIEYGRAAVAAFFAEHLAFAVPPEDMTDRPRLRPWPTRRITALVMGPFGSWRPPPAPPGSVGAAGYGKTPRYTKYKFRYKVQVSSLQRATR